MVSEQPGLVPEATGSLTLTRLWAAIIFVYQYYDYFNTHLMRFTSAEKTLWVKEAYKLLEATHWARLFSYRADNGSFAETSSRRHSKPADNRLATVGWAITTKTQLLSTVSSN